MHLTLNQRNADQRARIVEAGKARRAAQAHHSDAVMRQYEEACTALYGPEHGRSIRFNGETGWYYTALQGAEAACREDGVVLATQWMHAKAHEKELDITETDN